MDDSTGDYTDGMDSSSTDDGTTQPDAFTMALASFAYGAGSSLGSSVQNPPTPVAAPPASVTKPSISPNTILLVVAVLAAVLILRR